MGFLLVVRKAVILWMIKKDNHRRLPTHNNLIILLVLYPF